MDTLKAIHTRRSIRKYLEKDISPATIEELIKAAMNAPSAYNRQPWQFIIIDDKALLNKIPSISPHANMCKNARVAILVCGDTKLESSAFWVQGCSAATQNLLLAAHEKGIGSVWTGVFPDKEREKGFKELLKIPNDIIPFSLIVLGHTDEAENEKDNFKKERIHHNYF